jgi:hypothetical protein
MPQIISTPEEWFRNQRRDLYLICRLDIGLGI